MGDPSRGLFAMNVMMRCADIDATRDLDRAVSLRSSSDDAAELAAFGAGPSTLDIRPAA